MLSRRAWLLLSLVCLSCHSMQAVETVPPKPLAGQLWEKGQQAMREGQVEVAIAYYEESLTADPMLTRNHLSLAAAHLEKAEPREAAPHLAKYVEAHPEQWLVRARYAELLIRLKQHREATAQLERFIADAQELGDDAQRQLVNCHSRLMELAELTNDAYAEHLHRGIGLYLLGRERIRIDDDTVDLPAEGLFCKAAGELTLARLERPAEARPCLYLYAVWSQLGQRQPARQCLRHADAEAPFTYLTRGEQRDLQMACQRLSQDPVTK